jgi:hypothetical protein
VRDLRTVVLVSFAFCVVAGPARSLSSVSVDVEVNVAGGTQAFINHLVAEMGEQFNQTVDHIFNRADDSVRQAARR